ncbi:MAG: caspase family protein [Treponema sp.]|nr:caspase family protein [Treponema sp.]
MNKGFLVVLALLILFTSGVFAQENAPVKLALVIGNSAYIGLSPLANPENDANDITIVLQHLGFTVDKVLNGSLDQMEEAILRLKENLSMAQNAYGFFFYAGHGVQSNGENFLIPVDANIQSENFLRQRAVSVQLVLDELNDARNSLNVVVLDACRDNPFGWSRSGSRGLAIVSRQPADSIIVYATSAGQRASDGEGRNGLFTSQLLNNLATPGIDVAEVFRRTGADVAGASGMEQVPAVYSQFFGTAYLGETPTDLDHNAIAGSRPIIIYGGERERERDPAHFWSVGASVGSSFAAPWLIASLHGTIAPMKYSFIELGFDYGMVTGEGNVDYFSLYPFAHLVFYWPFTGQLGIYAGAGGGLLIVSYKFDGDDEYSDNIPIAALTAGVKILDMISVSYSLRTNFDGISHKASVGYNYRFK